MAGISSTSDRNYMDIINGTESTGKKYNAVFGDNKNTLSNQDFLTLMVNQLTHQDFMNPIDDAQYLAQMAQFSTMQEMMELSKFSKQSFVMGMLGQQVTISKNAIGGESRDVTGKVEKVVIEDNDFKVYVNGQPYDYSKIISIGESSGGNSNSASASDTGSDAEEYDPDAHPNAKG